MKRQIGWALRTVAATTLLAASAAAAEPSWEARLTEGARGVTLQAASFKQDLAKGRAAASRVCEKPRRVPYAEVDAVFRGSPKTKLASLVGVWRLLYRGPSDDAQAFPAGPSGPQTFPDVFLWADRGNDLIIQSNDTPGEPPFSAVHWAINTIDRVDKIRDGDPILDRDECRLSAAGLLLCTRGIAEGVVASCVGGALRAFCGPSKLRPAHRELEVFERDMDVPTIGADLLPDCP